MQARPHLLQQTRLSPHPRLLDVRVWAARGGPPKSACKRKAMYAIYCYVSTGKFGTAICKQLAQVSQLPPMLDVMEPNRIGQVGLGEDATETFGQYSPPMPFPERMPITHSRTRRLRLLAQITLLTGNRMLAPLYVGSASGGNSGHGLLVSAPRGSALSPPPQKRLRERLWDYAPQQPRAHAMAPLDYRGRRSRGHR